MSTKTTALQAAKIVSFIASTDADRAIAFYRDKLGLRLISSDDFAVVFSAHGAKLRIQMVQKVSAPPYTALGWQVPDIVASVKSLQKAGIVCEKFPGMDQDKLGIWKSPSRARIAWFKDPEGHILSLSQH